MEPADLGIAAATDGFADADLAHAAEADVSHATPTDASARNANVSPVPIAPSSDAALQSKLARLDALERTAALERSNRLRAARHARITAIIVTGLGVAAQIGGAIDLAGALGTTDPPSSAFLAIGSHPFIDSVVGIGLSIIGAIMWPVGTAHWVDAQRQINELSARGNP
ncbi:MAG: hypothetical protein JWN44_5359 [Myxococcales bacterium]|nr:hypothetical protein [Myxococcales bacterium]